MLGDVPLAVPELTEKESALIAEAPTPEEQRQNMQHEEDHENKRF